MWRQRSSQSKPRRYGKKSSCSGQMLIEVLLACAVFSFAAIGLANALNKALDASKLIDRETHVQFGLASHLAELKVRPFEIKVFPEEEPDAFGVVYQSSIQQIKGLENDKKAELTQLYVLTVRAFYKDGNEPMEDSAQVLVFR